MSYRDAKRLRAGLDAARVYLDRIATPVAAALGMCGHGRRHNWTVLASDLMIPLDGCACCAVWRAFILGLMAPFLIAGLIIVFALLLSVLPTVAVPFLMGVAAVFLFRLVGRWVLKGLRLPLDDVEPTI